MGDLGGSGFTGGGAGTTDGDGGGTRLTTCRPMIPPPKLLAFSALSIGDAVARRNVEIRAVWTLDALSVDLDAPRSAPPSRVVSRFPRHAPRLAPVGAVPGAMRSVEDADMRFDCWRADGNMGSCCGWETHGGGWPIGSEPSAGRPLLGSWLCVQKS